MEEEPTYTERDIQIVGDAVAFIRERHDQFVGDCPTGAYFAARLVQDLVLLDAVPVRVARSGSWYCVSAGRDWLASDRGAVSFEPFHCLMPMESGGRLYDRTEVILTALTDAVVTFGIDGTTWISGEPAHWKLPNDLDLSPSSKGRIVAFHYSKFSAAEER